jgi:hypothetical protein
MRLIRPAQPPDGRRRSVPRAATMMIVGMVAATMLAFVPASSPTAIGLLGVASALGMGIGGAYLLRALGRSPQRRTAAELARLLGSSFDDSYALLVEPRLPGVSTDLAGLLVGPGGVRALLMRDWDGHYRVRGRGWEYDARGRRGWIACRTNPSFEAEKLSQAVMRWAALADLDEHLPVAPAIVFPRRHSRVVLEEPDDEIVTTENAPWWAQRVGRVQRLDPSAVARVVEATLLASEQNSTAMVQPSPAVAVKRGG